MKLRDILERLEVGGDCPQTKAVREERISQAEQEILKLLLSEEDIKVMFGWSSIPMLHDHNCPCKDDGDDGSLYKYCKCKELNDFAKAISDKMISNVKGK